jgi:hypothetical protein
MLINRGVHVVSKRGDEQCSGKELILRQGGKNVSTAPCLIHGTMQDFVFFLSSFFLSPHGQERKKRKYYHLISEIWDLRSVTFLTSFTCNALIFLC